MVRVIFLTSLFTAGAYAARLVEVQGHEFVPGMQGVGQRSMTHQHAKHRGSAVGTAMTMDSNAHAQEIAAAPLLSNSDGDSVQSSRQQLSSLDGGSMQDIATAALAGDADQLAVFVADLSPAEQKKFAKMDAAIAEKIQSMSGITEPFGFFDPVGFCTKVSEGKLCFYREVELTHGRVCMLASLGFLVGEQWHPLFGGDIDVPSYIAFQQTPLQTFWPAVAAAIAVPELKRLKTLDKGWTMKTDRMEGDLGFDPLGIKPEDPEEFKEMQTKEINNGRLAMIAAAGMVAQELVDGEKILDFSSQAADIVR